MKKFLSEHPELAATIIAQLVLGAIGFGYFQANFATLQTKVQELESQGTAYRETRWVVEQHSKDIGEVKSDVRRQGDAIADIRADMKLVAAWVRQQQEREARGNK